MSKLENYNPNEYEIEYKITNKYKFFKNIQQFLQPIRFEKTKIYYFNSESKSSTEQRIRIIEDMESDKLICEQKDVIIKDNIPLDFYPNNIQVKVSKENEIKHENIPDKNNAIKICYRYRLIFELLKIEDFLNDFPFEVDLSLRVFPKDKTVKIPKFTDEDVFNPVYMKSNDFAIIYDLEFEILKNYKGDINSAFEKLKELFKKTNEEYYKQYGKFNEDSKIENESESKLINESKSESENESESKSESENESESKSESENEDSKIENEDSTINQLQILINSTFDFRQTPQVSVLTNRIIDSVDLSNFVYLEKTDGLRTLLICSNNKLYYYRNKEGLKEISSLQTKNTFVIDSELFEGKYYVFDVYFVNKDVRELPFIDRMNTFKELNLNSSEIIIKDYKQVDISGDKLSELIKYAMTKRPNVDGIVLQSKDGYSISDNKWLKQDYQYKLKPLELTTTDFLYKWIPDEKCYYLYLIGSFAELIFNLKSRPRSLQKAYSPFNVDLKNIPKNKSHLILFDTPLFDNMYKCEVNSDIIKDIENLKTSEIDPNKEGCLDGLIIETSFYLPSKNRIYQQTPIRIRWDKINPNGYRIGLTNACILFSPPTAENHYFHKITNEDVAKTFKLGEPLNENGESLINTFHIINQNIRDYTFEVLKEIMDKYSNLKESKYKTVFDLCGGRGSDLKRLYSLGFNNIIAADADAEALTIYSLKAIFYKSWNLNFGRLNLNCICEPLGNNGQELNLILKMKQRYEYRKCDLIVIDYALHYICDSKAVENLKNLMKIIKSVSNPDVFILINFYDGDKIIENKGDFKIFKIKINKLENETIAFMPLPTIEKDGYRKEPLLLNEHINILKAEGLNILKDYYPIVEKDFISDLGENEEMGKNISDYLGCIRSIIGRIN